MPIAKRCTGFSDCHNFGMGRGVMIPFAAIVAFRYHLICRDDDGPNRNFPSVASRFS
jgi:hypothetical protein